MQAGRKLDVLVAEKVMGWEDIHFDKNGNCFGKPPKDFPQQCSIHQVPHFSTNIMSAWRVVEKFSEYGWFATVCRFPCSSGANVHLQKVLSDGTPSNDKPIQVQEKTAPLAICLAALKAVGAVKEQVVDDD